MYIEKFDDAPCILIYRKALDSSKFVELIEDESEKDWPYLEWVKSGVGQDISVNEHRTSLEMPLFPISADTVADRLKPIQDEYLNNVFSKLNECIWDYRNLYELSLSRDNGWQVLKYSDDAEYHLHQDHSPENSRVLSVVASLGGDCSGGELEFPYFKKTFKLNTNDVAIFPSNFPYSHIAHPVTSGVKYSLVSWLL